MTLSLAKGMREQTARCIRSLALNGCRRGELLSLKQADVDVAGCCLRLRDSKVGAQMRPRWNAYVIEIEL